MKLTETKVKRHTVYNGSFIQVYEDDILLPNDQPAKRVVVDHVGAAAILPLTHDHRVVLVRQYRYAIGKESLEIPAGKKDFRGEPGLACAVRELEEETGYRAKTIKKLTAFYTAIGFSNELIELYVGTDCEPVEKPLEKDSDEFVETVILPFNEALEMVKKGLIQDAKTVIALSGLSVLQASPYSDKNER